MAETKLTTNTLEEKLLDRELKEICEKIETIGKQLREVFRKYEPMKEDFHDELQKFLTEHLRLAKASYCAGFTTEATAYVHPSWIPKELQKAILDWAVRDFMEQVESIQEIAI